MQTDVLTVPEDLPVSRLVDMMQAAHVKGAPVVDEGDRLVGFVSQEDIVLGSLGMPEQGERATASNATRPRLVRDIMTSPALFTTAQAKLADVGNMMWRLRIHHIPVVTKGRVIGMVSSLDFTRLLTDADLTDH